LPPRFVSILICTAALPGFRSAVGSRGNAELLDRVNAGPRDGEEAIVWTQEVVLGVIPS